MAIHQMSQLRHQWLINNNETKRLWTDGAGRHGDVATQGDADRRRRTRRPDEPTHPTGWRKTGKTKAVLSRADIDFKSELTGYRLPQIELG